MVRSATAALLALADQRLPNGGHVHSGGVEQAIADGVIHDLPSSERFLERRARVSGRVAAGLMAAAVTAAGRPGAPARMMRLDAEADARMASPAQRAASRAQGRGLLRLAAATWPAPSVHLAWRDLGPRPHLPLVLGSAARAAGVDRDDAAVATVYLVVTGAATAAQRLLALDPVTLAATTLRLGPLMEEVAAGALGPTDGLTPETVPETLPDDSDPLMDLLAERHAAREERLFAS